LVAPFPHLFSLSFATRLPHRLFWDGTVTRAVAYSRRKSARDRAHAIVIDRPRTEKCSSGNLGARMRRHSGTKPGHGYSVSADAICFPRTPREIGLGHVLAEPDRCSLQSPHGLLCVASRKSTLTGPSSRVCGRDHNFGPGPAPSIENRTWNQVTDRSS